MKRANIVRRSMMRASITVRSMEQSAVKKAREFWEDEQGIGVVEVILILVVIRTKENIPIFMCIACIQYIRIYLLYGKHNLLYGIHN